MRQAVRAAIAFLQAVRVLTACLPKDRIKLANKW
jgi:hypothetical protein